MSFKISVLTPSYNSVKFLDRAIQSVLDQDYTNWEHIVMDADSQDGTKEILANYPHLIWHSEPDNGQSDAMNKAFAKCTGDIIVYLNADDYFKEGAFNQAISVFNSHVDVDIVVGDLEVINDIDGTKNIIVPTLDLAEMLQLYQGLGFPANPVSYFYRKKVQAQVGEFPLDNHYTMDYWFLLRAISRFKVFKINYVLGTFWMDGNNKTSNTILSNKYLFSTALEYIQGNPLLNPSTWSEEIIFYLQNNFAILETHYRSLETHYRTLETNHEDIVSKYNNLVFNYNTSEENCNALKEENKGLHQEIIAIKNTEIWKIRTFFRNLFRK